MGYKGAREDLTYERAHEVFSYDPETGAFRYKIALYNNIKRPGDIAGWMRPDGRLTLTCDGIEYRQHRVAWLMMTGSWPQFEIDHRDLNPSNNRWDNLREATSSQNQAHRPVRRNSKTGVTGVTWHKQRKAWVARINRQHVGIFYSFEEAIEARRKAEATFHRDFMYHARP
jgi:hypothetical protein